MARALDTVPLPVLQTAEALCLLSNPTTAATPSTIRRIAPVNSRGGRPLGYVPRRRLSHPTISPIAKSRTS